MSEKIVADHDEYVDSVMKYCLISDELCCTILGIDPEVLKEYDCWPSMIKVYAERERKGRAKLRQIIENNLPAIYSMPDDEDEASEKL